jgi:hypothetical protein
MLSYSEVREKHVVLWAIAKVLSEFINVPKSVKSIECALTRCRIYQTSQHADRRCLPCAIMSKQSEDLPLVHRHVDTLYCLKTVVVNFP